MPSSPSSSIRRSTRHQSIQKREVTKKKDESIDSETSLSEAMVAAVGSRRRNSLYTAKQFPRHFVQHDYHDYAAVQAPSEAPVLKRKRGGVLLPFPLKLHLVLEKAEAQGFAHIISWQPHGRCFIIHQPKRFVQEIMPKCV